MRYSIDKNKYVIECSGEQMLLMARALEVFARLSIGQFRDALEPCNVLAADFPSELLQELRRHTDEMERLWQARRQPSSIRGAKRGDIAWDMHQVLRHRASWDAAGNPPQRTPDMFGVYFDEPFFTSGVDPIKVACGSVAVKVLVPEDFRFLDMHVYRDGGTLAMVVAAGGTRAEFFRDGRINSATYGNWFDRYPGDENAVEVPARISTALEELMKEKKKG